MGHGADHMILRHFLEIILFGRHCPRHSLRRLFQHSMSMGINYAHASALVRVYVERPRCRAGEKWETEPHYTQRLKECAIPFKEIHSHMGNHGTPPLMQCMTTDTRGA